jgi:hypothetical protein
MWLSFNVPVRGDTERPESGSAEAGATAAARSAMMVSVFVMAFPQWIENAPGI